MRGEQYIYISQQPKREIFVKFCFNVYFSISFLFFVFETFRISVVVVARILSSPFHSSFSCSYGIWRHDMAKWLDHATITNRRKNVDFLWFFFPLLSVFCLNADSRVWMHKEKTWNVEIANVAYTKGGHEDSLMEIVCVVYWKRDWRWFLLQQTSVPLISTFFRCGPQKKRLEDRLQSTRIQIECVFCVCMREYANSQ